MGEFVVADRVSRQSQVVNQELLENTVVNICGDDVASDLVHLGLIGLNVKGIVRKEQGPLFDTLAVDTKKLNYFQEAKTDGNYDYVICSKKEYSVKNNRLTFPRNNSYLAGMVAGRTLNALVRSIEQKDAILTEDNVESIDRKVSQKVLVVGAGGTGTYTAISALIAGYDVCVIDQDTIETSNFNRQVLYGGRQGEYKSEVLSQALNPLGNIEGVVGLIQDNKKLLSTYKDSIVFSCVDNTDTRIFLDEQRDEQGYTLIDTGTGPSNGRVHVAQNQSLQEQVVLIPEKKASCVLAAPSVVMPNMVVGSLAVHSAISKSQKPILYRGLNNEVVF